MIEKVKFENFLQRFPEVEAPVTLSDDTHFDFEQNDPLQAAMIKDFIARYEPTEADDFTEYMAGFRLPQLDKREYTAIVYWKAGLMQYDYVLATYNKTGDMLDKKSIAGTQVVGNTVIHTLATIDEKHAIIAAEGSAFEGEEYEASRTKAKRFQILENGLIEQEY
jgi:hypothetical protein